MYQVAVRREFTALHYLVGGDWGAENITHAHHYTLELELSGANLNEDGFLVNILEVEACLEALVAKYSQGTLNDFPEFGGLNPSLENFARLLWSAARRAIPADNLSRMTIRLWENQSAWAAYALDI